MSMCSPCLVHHRSEDVLPATGTSDTTGPVVHGDEDPDMFDIPFDDALSRLLQLERTREALQVQDNNLKLARSHILLTRQRHARTTEICEAYEDEHFGVRTTPSSFPSNAGGRVRNCRYPSCDGTGHRILSRWHEGHSDQRSCPIKAGISPPPAVGMSLSRQMAQHIEEAKAAALSTPGSTMHTRHAAGCTKRKRTDSDLDLAGPCEKK